MTWTLNKFTSLGLDVAYTELDMRIKGVAIDAVSIEQQAKEYEAVVGSCLDTARCVGVTVWGFGDAHSWIKNGDPDLFDKKHQAEAGFFQIVGPARQREREEAAVEHSHDSHDGSDGGPSCEGQKIH